MRDQRALFWAETRQRNAHHKLFTKENQPPVQRQNGRFCQFLGWTISFSYGIIIPITRRFPSLHVQPIFPGVGHMGITFGFFLAGWGWYIKTWIQSHWHHRLHHWEKRWWLAVTHYIHTGEILPWCFLFRTIYFFAHWMPGSSISFLSLSMAIKSNPEIRQGL